MADDPQLREMTCDPKFRKVLVTDGKTAVGQALVKALVEAGADLVWVGIRRAVEEVRRLRRAEALPQVDAACRSTSPTRRTCASSPARSAARSTS